MKTDDGEFTLLWVSSPSSWIPRKLQPMLTLVFVIPFVLEPSSDTAVSLMVGVIFVIWLWVQFLSCFDVQIMGDTLYLKRGREEFTIVLDDRVRLKRLGNLTEDRHWLWGRRKSQQDHSLASILQRDTSFRSHVELRWRGQATLRHTARFYHPKRRDSSGDALQPGLRWLTQRLIELDVEQIEQRLAAKASDVTAAADKGGSAHR